MSTFQIWGQFLENDGNMSLSSVSMFRKDGLMDDGFTNIEDFERALAARDGEKFSLMYEFEVTAVDGLSVGPISSLEDVEHRLALEVLTTYLESFQLSEEDR